MKWVCLSLILCCFGVKLVLCANGLQVRIAMIVVVVVVIPMNVNMRGRRGRRRERSIIRIVGRMMIPLMIGSREHLCIASSHITLRLALKLKVRICSPIYCVINAAPCPGSECCLLLVLKKACLVLGAALESNVISVRLNLASSGAQRNGDCTCPKILQPVPHQVQEQDPPYPFSLSSRQEHDKATTLSEIQFTVRNLKCEFLLLLFRSSGYVALRRDTIRYI